MSNKTEEVGDGPFSEIVALFTESNALDTSTRQSYEHLYIMNNIHVGVRHLPSIACAHALIHMSMLLFCIRTFKSRAFGQFLNLPWSQYCMMYRFLYRITDDLSIQSVCVQFVSKRTLWRYLDIAAFHGILNLGQNILIFALSMSIQGRSNSEPAGRSDQASSWEWKLCKTPSQPRHFVQSNHTVAFV